ncbi:hypothetical protein FIV07_28080 (plasmid) [Mycobacterium sp. THAF192]|nr:hypothetical protein FIV07_28080 [Mycobacterium sp. THAF192]
MSTTGRPTRPGGPAPQPCRSCPYRRDAPSGVWAAEEYAKLADYDADTALQPPRLFLCHQTDADHPRLRLCAGWVGCHGSDLLALRLAVSRGAIDPADAASAFSYTTTTPLFDSGTAAAAHGTRDLASPGPGAQQAIDKIRRRRSER